MKQSQVLDGPSDEELREIEIAGELLAAELALADAEAAWYVRPSPDTAADFLAAVAEVVDLHDSYGYDTTAGAVVRDAVQGVA